MSQYCINNTCLHSFLLWEVSLQKYLLELWQTRVNPLNSGLITVGQEELLPGISRVLMNRLFQHINLLLNGRRTDDLNILVPLCGKSVDLIWLKNQGFKEVIGVEAVETAIHQFSSQSGIPLRQTFFRDTGVRSFESDDGFLQILHTDFFALDHPSINGSIDCVWDRASLVAILPEHRTIYAETMKRLLKKDFRYLLSVIEYDPSRREGPPHSITQDDVEDTFGPLVYTQRMDGSKRMFGRHPGNTRPLYLLTPGQMRLVKRDAQYDYV